MYLRCMQVFVFHICDYFFSSFFLSFKCCVLWCGACIQSVISVVEKKFFDAFVPHYNHHYFIKLWQMSSEIKQRMQKMQVIIHRWQIVVRFACACIHKWWRRWKKKQKWMNKTATNDVFKWTAHIQLINISFAYI